MNPKAGAGAPEAKLWRVLALPALLDSGNLAASGKHCQPPPPSSAVCDIQWTAPMRQPLHSMPA